MYQDNECRFYYLSVYNENYPMPPMPEHARDGILRGMYRLHGTDSSPDQQVRPQLFGSGPILRSAEEAQQILKERYGIGADLWSVTSYSELTRDAQATDRHNRLHPTEEPRKSYVEETLSDLSGPFIAVSDNVRLVPEQIRRWVPGEYVTLGTDGFGRSDTREALRHHFGVDAAHVAYATLLTLSRQGFFDRNRLPEVMTELGLQEGQTDAIMA